MRQTFFLLALTFFLTSCNNSQTNKKAPHLTGDIKNDLRNLIPKGSYTVSIMDGVRQNPRQAVLTKKFQEGVKNNYEWFLQYMKTVPEGQPMPYHAKLGLTKEEYKELTAYFNNVEIVSTGKEIITIEEKNDTIYFKSQGKLSDFNALKIDLKNNTAIFGQYKMIFTDTVNITDDRNGLRSKWKGYTWRFEEPGDLSFDNLKDPNTLRMKQYKLTIGILEKNGKTYMSLKGREVEEGVRTSDFELPVIF